MSRRFRIKYFRNRCLRFARPKNCCDYLSVQPLSRSNLILSQSNTTAPVQTLAWSRLNELLSVTTGATVESYRYDADGERIYQQSATGSIMDWQEWDYFPHYQVRKVAGVETVTKYYFFNGQRIAQKVGSGVLTYLHADHLGSTVLTTGVSGSRKYHAYGSARSGSVPTDIQFTGQMTSTTGLVYMHARYYDPVTGIFISPDTIIPDPNDVLSYNRYLYARGNPMKFTDPSGHDPLDGAWQEEFYRVHGRYPDANDEALRLFSIAYPGEWNEASFYAESGQLRDLEGIKNYLHDKSRRNWDGLGQTLESMAGWYKDDEADLFAQDLSFLFGGTRGRSQTGDGPYWQSGHYGSNLDVFIGRGGLPEKYFDRPGQDDDDFNVHHFAWAFAVGYNAGAAMGRFINTTKEWSDAPLNVDQSDLEMGGLGARLGGALKSDRSVLRSLSSRLYGALGYEP